MRTIKASEVVKGMRVRVERTRANVNTTIEGEVCQVFPSGTDVRYVFENGDTWILAPDHPVTVLAEPEPEWVEGAWYWVDGGPMIRRANGWHGDPTDKGDFPDLYDSEVDSASVKRVLIVDWPGDEYASKLVETYGAGLTWDDFECSPLQKVADAIRAQGGAR